MIIIYVLMVAVYVGYLAGTSWGYLPSPETLDKWKVALLGTVEILTITTIVGGAYILSAMYISEHIKT